MARKKIFFLTVLLSMSMLQPTARAKNINDPINVLVNISSGCTVKSDIPVSATIDGHALTIYINENVGIAHIVVTNSNGVYIDSNNILHTPDMATLLIEDEGLYTVTITLNNGEVYYGDFYVTE
ncbi:MAG: DUF3244 domain-containing protein [Bacteroidales bacterium]|nr:DUF3244 domain-containing protein [Bacteroidales bacterium]